MVFQGLYYSKNQTEITDLVKMQPSPQIFYRSFLDLDGANILSILSFDSRSLTYMLGDQFSEYFQSEYPLIYRNRLQKQKKVRNSSSEPKSYYRTAVDHAIKNNQSRAMEVLIDYISKF